MDFTIKRYLKLLQAIITANYEFQTFADFITSPKKKVVVLRHDVDKLPFNSLRFAEIQHNLNIQGTYYFRTVPQSWNEYIIKKIASLNHEIGYHYESLTTTKGDIDAAFIDFKNNLMRFRNLVNVKTICMHGSPKSPYDSKEIWKKHSYRDLGIIAEPYFDVDYSKVFYLTDTGRCWDGFKFSIRDKINSQQEVWIKQNLVFHSTKDIITALQENRLPDKIIFTFHPQRWNSNILLWTKELVYQNIKNVVKHFIVKSQEKKLST